MKKKGLAGLQRRVFMKKKVDLKRRGLYEEKELT